MNKYHIPAVTVLMGLLVASLVSIQVYWINNAVALREQQFNRHVKDALINVANRIEQAETWNYLNDGGATDHVLHADDYTVPGLQGNVHVVQHEVYSPNCKDPFEQNIPTANTSNYENVSMEANAVVPETMIELDTSMTMDDSLGCTYYQSVICIQVDDSAQWYTFTHNSPEQIQYTLMNQTNKIEQRRQMVSNLFLRLLEPPSLSDRVSKEELELYLREELGRRDIHTDYEFAVYSSYGAPIYHSTGYANDMPAQSHRVILFPNDIFASPNQLMVHFPNKKAYILSSLGIMAFSSMLIILIITLCFVYTVYIIFRQKKLSDMKTDFINNMTHELKTPVATISLASEMLMNKDVAADQVRLQRFANVIYEENKRLGGQVEKVLQMAVLDKGGAKLNLNQVDVHDRIKAIVDKMALQMDDRGGDFALDLKATRTHITADELHLTNIITDLVDNALKYSADTPHVTIATEDASNGIVISVTDRGIGMNKEQQKRIFEKFYRVPTGNIHNVKGFGLGLSYVKAMVEAHAGSIRLRSELLQGSTFEVFLPYTVNQ
ncbi:HAMP domain-containing sensor histidine kinase [soil metagenome]